MRTASLVLLCLVGFGHANLMESPESPQMSLAEFLLAPSLARTAHLKRAAPKLSQHGIGSRRASKLPITMGIMGDSLPANPEPTVLSEEEEKKLVKALSEKLKFLEEAMENKRPFEDTGKLKMKKKAPLQYLQFNDYKVMYPQELDEANALWESNINALEKNKADWRLREIKEIVPEDVENFKAIGEKLYGAK
jgi:hypothetical protein